MHLLLVAAMAASAVFIAQPAQATADELSDLAALLPPDAAERFAAVNEMAGISTEWTDQLLAAIDPDDYECEQSALSQLLDAEFGQLDMDTLQLLFMAGVPYWTADYTVLFDHDPSDTYVGVQGEHTKEQIKRLRSNKRFWDVYTDDIQLHGLHGADIADDSKMVPLVQFVLGPDVDAQGIVDAAQALIESDPLLDYDHPLFSLNAFAVPGFEIPGFTVVPDKIVMGDGLLDAVTALGFGDTAPDLILAHEFAHHVQFELGEAPPYGDPETDRRTELMADAFGSYYLAHARGASFQAKRILGAVETSGSVGDCGFDQPGHHGTPNQRAATAQWAAELADQARPQGKILSATTMVDLFDAELPNLVAPDAG